MGDRPETIPGGVVNLLSLLIQPVVAENKHLTKKQLIKYL